MRIHLDSVGCRLNEAELETWSEQFKASHYSITSDGTDADLIVFNTCAVTQQAVRRSRQAIRKLQRQAPEAKVVVSGCYASLEPQDAAELGVDLVIHNQDKVRLVEIAKRQLDLPAMPEAATMPAENALFARRRQRAFVKVQDGCRYRCTYCIVTVARGDEKSRSIADVVDEVNQLVDHGVQEIVLTGVHLGGYGSDIGLRLFDLIHAVLSDTEVPRLRLGSLEPWGLPEYFFTVFENARMMPHLHLPLQSGCDSVLRRMSRRCKTAEFRALIEQARREVAHFNVTTDVIVGFPGETDDEFQASLDYIGSIGFGHCHIFSYSPRTGTKASGLPRQIGAELKKSRSQALHQLANRMKHHTMQRYTGSEFPVLIEGQGQRQADGTVQYLGYTPNYLRTSINVPADQDISNKVLMLKLSGFNREAGTMQGQIDRSASVE